MKNKETHIGLGEKKTIIVNHANQNRRHSGTFENRKLGVLISEDLELTSGWHLKGSLEQL